MVREMNLLPASCILVLSELNYIHIPLWRTMTNLVFFMLGMDMGLFYANLNDESNQGYREAAYRVFTCNFNDPINYEHFNNYKFDRKSPKAAAMGDAMQHKLSVKF